MAARRKKKIIKRREERIPTNFIVKFVREDDLCYGITENISERGMCICTGFCLPCDTNSSVLIPVGNDHIEIDFKVRWIKRTGDFYDMMGVELINIHPKYKKLLQGLRRGVKFNLITSSYPKSFRSPHV